MPMRKNPHAVALGRRGGLANTPAQALARARPKGGGQPRRYRLTPDGALERRHDDRWLELQRPYDRSARAALRRLT